jgi:peptide/nickel transport system ATP-binding protein
MNILEIENLHISFNNQKPVIQGISLTLAKGECLGIVGESGSGKSLTALTVMGLLPPTAHILADRLVFNTDTESIDLHQISAKEHLRLRGDKMAMIFQEPMTSLNPFLRCGHQVVEVLQLHHFGSKEAQRQRVISLFNEVQLPNPDELYQKYPHQLSGGQRQRVMIAMALACNPQLLIADEPTTALDVSVQQEIIMLINDLRKKHGLAVIFISHDLALVKQIADKAIVLYHGQMVEQGNAEQLFQHPAHLYTKGLINCKPKGNERIRPLPTVSDFLDKIEIERKSEPLAQRQLRHTEIYSQDPILQVNNLEVNYRKSGQSMFAKELNFKALKKVSFSVYPGETLGLVGESGCGKSTLGRAIVQLVNTSSGDILFRGKKISELTHNEQKDIKRRIQIIFQDPFSSLNPRQTIADAVKEPMIVHNLETNNAGRNEKVAWLFERVGLNASFYDRYPHELSGGQRQRVAIARALALNPELVICDESVSALDVSVQAMVLNLLNQLKDELSLTYIFISHDLSVVRYMADRIAVMQNGNLIELAEADWLFNNPQEAYTRKLLDCIPL